MDIISRITSLVAIVFAVAGFMFAVSTGLDKSEIVTCNKYQQYAKDFEGFWITQEDFDMCNHHGIFVDSLILTSDGEDNAS